jgi:hypothetical protein
MQELRARLYERYPVRSNITVSRGNFLNDALHIYNNPDINLLAQPLVTFAGEPGNLQNES